MTDPDFKPPWEQVNAFLEKPKDDPYGYVLRNKLISCSQEELIRRCGSQDIPQITLVWHPDAARIVPAEQVPFLFEAVKGRTKKTLKVTFWAGFLNLMIFGLLASTSWEEQRQRFIFLGLLGLMLGVIPMIQSVHGLRTLKHLPRPSETIVPVGNYAAWVMSRSVRVTWIIFGSLALIGVLQLMFGFDRTIQAAGLDKVAVRQGQWWRVLTGPLLHGSVMHLMFNGLALIGLGRVMEVLSSRSHLALTFLIAALAGSLSSTWLLPHTTSVGASGGILRLIGFLLVLGYRRKSNLPPGFAKSIMVNVALIALMGVLAYSIIDNAAHLGGFLAGVAIGSIMIERGNPVLPLPCGTGLRVVGLAALLMLLLIVGVAGYRIISAQ